MFEVSCGNCQGRLLVQQAGVVVACPHCGTHLTIGAPPPAAAPAAAPVPPPQPQYAPPPQVTAPAPQPTYAPAPQFAPPQPVPQPVAAAPQSQWAAPPAPVAPAPVMPPPQYAPAPVPAPQPTQFELPAEEPSEPEEEPAGLAADWMNAQAAAAPVFGAPAAVAAPAPAPYAAAPAQPAYQPVAEQPAWATAAPVPAAPAPEYAPAPTYAAPAPAPVSVPAAYQPAPQPMMPEPAAQPGAAPYWFDGGNAAPAQGQETYGLGQQVAAPPLTITAPASSLPPKPQPNKTVSRGSFILLANYASLVTVAALALAYLVMTGGGSDSLPNLPDVEPQKVKNKGTGKMEIGYGPAPINFALNDTQRLAIGETKRYGHLEVTPLKVTRGRIEFVNASGGAAGLLSSPVDVLKLHLRFKNLSKDSSIAPLRSLAFKQTGTGEKRESNNVVYNPKLKNVPILAYPLSKEERIKGLDIDTELKPGESCELFIPTNNDRLDLMLSKASDLVWRVHFRKGYSPNNFGVTTLIQVNFPKDKITNEI